MIKFGYLFLGLFLLYSCGNEESEAIDLNDIIEGSDRYAEDSLNMESQNDVQDTLAVFLTDFTSNGIDASEIKAFEEQFFPDRLGPIATKKFELIGSANTFRYMHWSFPDSAKVINAFYNWMDCFGANCKSIFIGEERLFQSNPFQLFVNDSVLIYIEANESFDFDIWEEYLTQKGYAPDWNYVIEQRKRSKAKWFNFIEEKKTALKK